MICETGISYRSWMGLRNIVTTSLLPLPWFVLITAILFTNAFVPSLQMSAQWEKLLILLEK